MGEILFSICGNAAFKRDVSGKIDRTFHLQDGPEPIDTTVTFNALHREGNEEIPDILTIRAQRGNHPSSPVHVSALRSRPGHIEVADWGMLERGGSVNLDISPDFTSCPPNPQFISVTRD